MKVNLRQILLCSFGILILGCKKDVDSNLNYHSDYYPLIQGTFVVYEALEIAHDAQAIIQHDSTKFFIKTVIDEPLEDLEGDLAYKFIRYWKINLNDEWVVKDVWTTKLKHFRVELMEENQRTVKLIFPVKLDQIWNINSLNSNSELNAQYDENTLHASRIFNDLTFDSTVQINQQDFFSLVDHRKKFEVYAKNVGLIYKFYKDNDILNFDTLNIRYGREIYYKVIDFGKE